MQTKKVFVLDSNFRNDPSLREWLSTPNNYVAITDFASIEAYKGDEVRSIRWSLEILSKFPSKVIVLKPTGEICKLNGISRGLRRRLIDAPTTRRFNEYASAVMQMGDDASVVEQILERQRAANAEIDRISERLFLVKDATAIFMKKFDKVEREMLKAKGVMTKDLQKKVVSYIRALSTTLTKMSQPGIKYYYGEPHNYFTFRFAISQFMLMCDIISNGGNQPKEEVAINNMIDMTYCAYATYFDGLLTRDKKLIDIYKRTSDLLSLFERAAV